MILRSRIPAPPLNRLVERLWYFEDLKVSHSREHRLPDASVGLVIDLGESPKKLYDRASPVRCTHYRRSWVSGAQRQYIVIGAERGSSMMGAHFHPGGAAPLFSFPLSELTGSVVELDLIWKRDIHALRDRLLETVDVEARFDLLEAFLLARMGTRPVPDGAVRAALARLRSWPVVPLAGLASELGLTHRQMISRFSADVGLTPKLVSRLLRFHAVLADVHTAGDGAPDWSALAVERGYFDQSHFIHEFREFAGVTPTEYLARRSPYPRFLYLD